MVKEGELMAANTLNDRLTAAGKKLVAVVAVVVGVIHLLNVTGTLVMSTLTLRVIHLMAMLVIVLLGGKKAAPTLAAGLTRAALALCAVVCSVYLLFRWESISTSGGVTNSTDVIMGVILVLVVIEATRRTVGCALAIIVAVFLAYPFVAAYLPGVFQGRNYSVSRIFGFLFTTTEGLYGTPLGVSTYIVLFCIYGAFLSEFGAGTFLFRLSTAVTQKFVAATAKTAIIFNLLIGMISGSAAGNVAITGTLTIPMMEKRGYTPEKAGAITAVAATGAQIMPPVMGAAAFIMAEITGYSYASIMKAAIIPALLFFATLVIICTYEARKGGFDIYQEGEAKESLSAVLREGWYYLVPIITLVAMLIVGYSPFKAAYFSSLALIVVYLAAMIAKQRGVSGGLLLDVGKKIVSAIKKGALDTGSLAIACAASGIIVGVLSITGLGAKLSLFIVSVSGGNALIALILTMLTSIVLGMGLPTTAAYLVLASVVVPALVNMSIPLIAAHMFVFFFGCISTITPPVALASYVAAGIANADLNRVGWTAFRYGIVSFVLPFMFVFSPSLLMEGSAVSIVTTVILSFIGTFAIALAVVGYFKTDFALWQRILLFVSGILMIDEGLVTDIIGIALLIGCLALNRMAARRTNTNKAEGEHA
mgnify:CR=1 FL=1